MKSRPKGLAVSILAYKVKELLDLFSQAPSTPADPRLSELHRRRFS
jgi:hypothetical protein